MGSRPYRNTLLFLHEKCLQFSDFYFIIFAKQRFKLFRFLCFYNGSHELQTCDWPRNVGCLTGAEALAATKTKTSSRPSNAEQKLSSPVTQFLNSEYYCSYFLFIYFSWGWGTFALLVTSVLILLQLHRSSKTSNRIQAAVPAPSSSSRTRTNNSPLTFEVSRLKVIGTFSFVTFAIDFSSGAAAAGGRRC